MRRACGGSEGQSSSRRMLQPATAFTSSVTHDSLSSGSSAMYMPVAQKAEEGVHALLAHFHAWHPRAERVAQLVADPHVRVHLGGFLPLAQRAEAEERVGLVDAVLHGLLQLLAVGVLAIGRLDGHRMKDWKDVLFNPGVAFVVAVADEDPHGVECERFRTLSPVARDGCCP